MSTAGWSVFAIYSTDNILVAVEGSDALEKYSLAFTTSKQQFAVQACHYLRDNVLSVKTTQQRFDHARRTVEFVENSSSVDREIVNHGVELIRKGWVAFDGNTTSPDYVSADREFKDSPSGRQGPGRIPRFGLKNQVTYPLGDDAAAEDADAVEALGLHMLHTILEGYVEEMYSPTCFDFRTQNNTIFKVQVCGLTTDQMDLRDGKITRAAKAKLLHRFMILMVEEYDSTNRILLVNPGTDLYPYAEFIADGHVRVDPTTLSFAARFAVDKYLKTEEAEIAADEPVNTMNRRGGANNNNSAASPDTNIWLKEPRNFNRDEVLQFQATVVAVLSHNEVVVAKEPRDRNNIDPTYYTIRLPFIASCAGRNLLSGFPGKEIITASTVAAKIDGNDDTAGGSDNNAGAAAQQQLNSLRNRCHNTLYSAWWRLHSYLMGRMVDVTPIHSFAHPESKKRVQYARVATVRPEQAFGVGNVAEGIEPATTLLAEGRVELEPLDLFPLGICLQPSTDYYQSASKGQSKIASMVDDEIDIVGGLGSFTSANSTAANTPIVEKYGQIFAQALDNQKKQAEHMTHTPHSTVVPAISPYGSINPLGQQQQNQQQQGDELRARVVDLESPTRLVVAIESKFDPKSRAEDGITEVTILRVQVQGVIAPEKEIDSDQYFLLYTEACKVLCGGGGSSSSSNRGGPGAPPPANNSKEEGSIKIAFSGRTFTTTDNSCEEIPEVRVRFNTASSSAAGENNNNNSTSPAASSWEDYSQWLVNNGFAAPSGSTNTVEEKESFSALAEKTRTNIVEASVGIWAPKAESLRKSLERTRTQITGVSTEGCYVAPREGHLLYVKSHNDFYIWWIDTATDDNGCVLSATEQQQLQRIAAQSPSADLSKLGEGNMVFIFVQGIWHRALVAAIQPEPLFVPVDQFCVGGVQMASLKGGNKKGDVIKMIDQADIPTLQNSLPPPNVIRAHHAFLTIGGSSNTTTNADLKPVQKFTQSYVEKKVIDVAIEYHQVMPPFSTGVSLIPKDSKEPPSQIAMLTEFDEEQVQTDVKMSLFVNKFADKIRAMRSVKRPGGIDAPPATL